MIVHPITLVVDDYFLSMFLVMRYMPTIPGVPKKAERLIFITLIFENIAYFISSDKALSCEKNDTKII